MESTEIQRNIQSLDNSARSLGQTISTLNSQAHGYMNQAYTYRQEAQRLEDQSYYEEDVDNRIELRRQAARCMAEADDMEEQASRAASEAEQYKNELRGYREQYQYYYDMGMTKLADLEIAVQKLSGLSSAAYGRDKLMQALQQSRQRITFNQSLVKACQERMNWIDQVCGSGGSQYQRVLRR